MSTPPLNRYTRPGIDPRLVRDLIALLLITLGAVAVVYAGFLAGRAAGWAVVGVLALTAGGALAYDRPTR